jgi:hypothetical protein
LIFINRKSRMQFILHPASIIFRFTAQPEAGNSPAFPGTRPWIWMLLSQIRRHYVGDMRFAALRRGCFGICFIFFL